MRPDKHKKKSHANYAKKNAQKSGKKATASDSKSGTFADKRQHDTHERVVNGRDNEAQNKTQPKSPGGNLHQGNAVDTVQSGSSFSRRKIESNWEKYDTIHNEEQVVGSRGRDFSLLLNQTAGSQFRFKEEETLDDDDDNEEAGMMSNLLSFNCNDLAEKLQSIALPERLDISRSIFDLELLELLDQDAATSSNIMGSPDVRSTTREESASRTSFNEGDEGKDIHFDQDLENILSLTDTDNNCDQETKPVLYSNTNITGDVHPMDGLDYTEDNINRITDNEICEVKSSKEQQHQQHLSQPSHLPQDEDELDFLLSLTQSPPGSNKESDANIQPIAEKQEPEMDSNNHSKIGTSVSPLGISTSGLQSKADDIKTELPAHSGTTSDGLDDWLDSILDD